MKLLPLFFAGIAFAQTTAPAADGLDARGRKNKNKNKKNNKKNTTTTTEAPTTTTTDAPTTTSTTTTTTTSTTTTTTTSAAPMTDARTKASKDAFANLLSNQNAASAASASQIAATSAGRNEGTGASNSIPETNECFTCAVDNPNTSDPFEVIRQCQDSGRVLSCNKGDSCMVESRMRGGNTYQVSYLNFRGKKLNPSGDPLNFGVSLKKFKNPPPH